MAKQESQRDVGDRLVMTHISIKKAGFKEITLWLLGKRKRFRIQGRSMEPILKEGDEVLIRKIKTPSVGDIIIAKHPIQTDLTIIKQIQSIKEGQIELKGINNKTSSGSHTFGGIKNKQIIGHLSSKLTNT